MKYIDLGDIQLATYDAGAGPPIVFLHGFPLDHTMWFPHLERLADRWRVIAPDLRGFGQSDVTDGVAAMETFADDIQRLLDKLHETEPVILVGLSMGGYIGWQFWRRYAARLAGLVLCDTRAANDTEEVARGRLQTAERALVQGAGVIATPMVERLFAPETIAQKPALPESVRKVILGTSTQGIAAALRGMAQRPDVRTWLPEIQIPTLVVCGEHDVISPPTEMREMASTMPRATYAEIPHAGHMAPLEQPAAFAQVLDDWLARFFPS